jgi:hypothetical protein
MAFSILFSDDPEMDAISLFKFINDFTAGLGQAEVEIDVEKCYSLLRLMRQDFPHKDGLDEANVFKKVSYFMCFFISERPILEPFSKKNIGEDLAEMANHQNAIVALQLAIESLHGAVVKANSEEPKKLENRIELSAHSYRDIIDSIKSIMPRDDFKLVAVLLEQLAYKTNPDCQYPVIDV